MLVRKEKHPFTLPKWQLEKHRKKIDIFGIIAIVDGLNNDINVMVETIKICEYY